MGSEGVIVGVTKLSFDVRQLVCIKASSHIISKPLVKGGVVILISFLLSKAEVDQG